MNLFTVIYSIVSEGDCLQFFQCHADDADHAKEQCLDAYPDCTVLCINPGHGPASQTLGVQP